MYVLHTALNRSISNLEVIRVIRNRVDGVKIGWHGWVARHGVPLDEVRFSPNISLQAAGFYTELCGHGLPLKLLSEMASEDWPDVLSSHLELVGELFFFHHLELSLNLYTLGDHLRKAIKPLLPQQLLDIIRWPPAIISRHVSGILLCDHLEGFCSNAGDFLEDVSGPFSYKAKDKNLAATSAANILWLKNKIPL